MKTLNIKQIIKRKITDEESLSINLDELKDEQIDILVSKLAQFINLNSLELISNIKQMIILDKILQKMSQIKQLRVYLDSTYLFLSSQDYSQDKIETCFRKFSNLTDLDFNISFSELQPQNLKNLFDDLKQCHMLVSLKLNLRKQLSLNEQNIHDLGTLIGSLTNLQRLNVSLWDNNISRQCFTHLAQGIYQGGINLTNITFNLEFTFINDDILAELGIAFSKCSNLKSLSIDLKFNQIKSIGLSQFVHSLSKCLNLTQLELDFGWNKFRNLGAHHLTSKLNSLISLKYLYLSIMSCEIDNKGMLEISNRLRECTQLNLIKICILGNGDFAIKKEAKDFYNKLKHIPYLISIL
ncbi:kinase domain protein (macronuclear) [Tetrahymena thermophila SB210]|uniref:Kinase domain protein n=1 Tax=Tetrahymena thermophila (strain SB210) TaxID=312017 RepID=Q233S7_TETTS|nr:kinase domain protein [Tetrahymena thermophila SB210]EAR91752.2 kinase domain protein [Tetrahymena thermophila SB210]|eukprot:XP_001011997.2 kinase domain protein [Tetrahymena thermophila SB210]